MKHSTVKQIDYFASKEHIEEEVRKHTSYIASKMPDEGGSINTSVILEKQDNVMFCTLFQNAWRELLRIISGYRKCCDFVPDKHVTLEAQFENRKLIVAPLSLVFNSDTRQLTVAPTSLEFGADLPETKIVTLTPSYINLYANGNLKTARKLTVIPTNILIQ